MPPAVFVGATTFSTSTRSSRGTRRLAAMVDPKKRAGVSKRILCGTKCNLPCRPGPTEGDRGRCRVVPPAGFQNMRRRRHRRGMRTRGRAKSASGYTCTVQTSSKLVEDGAQAAGCAASRWPLSTFNGRGALRCRKGGGRSRCWSRHVSRQGVPSDQACNSTARLSATPAPPPPRPALVPRLAPCVGTALQGRGEPLTVLAVVLVAWGGTGEREGQEATGPGRGVCVSRASRDGMVRPHPPGLLPGGPDPLSPPPCW